MNNDGTDDIVAGSYPGDIYFFEGKKDGTFKKPELVKDSSSEAIGKYSCVIEPFDMDNDGDLDLVASYRMRPGRWYENKGTKNEFRFENKTNKLTTKTDGGVQGSHLHFADWDNDGLVDIISGNEWGNVSLYRNVGSKSEPVFASHQKLIVNFPSDKKGKTRYPHGGRIKIDVHDYDGDGRLDILIGDSTDETVVTGPPLTEKEKVEKAKLDDELDQLHDEIDNKPLYEKLRKATAERDKKRYDEIFDEIERINKPISDLYEKLKKYEREDYKSHGWVWFYRQLEPKQVLVPESEVGAKPPATHPWKQPVSEGPVNVSFHSSHNSVAANDTIQVAVQFRMESGWHIYGSEEGDGYLPTKIEWTLPEGFKVTKTIWTVPKTKEEFGSLKPVYQRTATAIVTIAAPSDLAKETKAKLVADVSFQVCKEQCKRGSTSAEFPLGLGKTLPNKDAELIKDSVSEIRDQIRKHAKENSDSDGGKSK